MLGRALSVSQAVGRAASLAYSAPLLGKASPCLYPAAIPPHLCRGEPRQKCSGQPGGSRSGCWRRQCRNKSATDCAGGFVPGSIHCRERRTAIRASEPSRLSPVRRQERSSLREGTTPPLRRSLRTSRNLRFSVVKVRVPLQQSSLREGARDHCFRYVTRNEGMEVCVGGKCRPEDRQCRATGITRLQRWWYASILPPYAASAAGSFQAVTPLPPQAPSEESRPSTPR